MGHFPGQRPQNHSVTPFTLIGFPCSSQQIQAQNSGRNDYVRSWRLAGSLNEEVTVRVETRKPHRAGAGRNELFLEMAADDLKKLQAARAKVSAPVQRVRDRVALVILDEKTGRYEVGVVCGMCKKQSTESTRR